MNEPTEARLTSAAPSISVAMATYQGEKFLRQQLKSIANQALLPSELVITDDQSSDATEQIVADFGRNAPFPVRFYRNEARLGYKENFLRAISLCRGDLIALCDQDDLWLQKKLSTCTPYFQDTDVQLVCHTGQTLFPGGELGYFFPHFSRTQELAHGTCDPLENRPGFAMVFRRSLLSALPVQNRPERLQAHDHLVWFLAAVSGKVVKLSEVLVHYRQHEKNVFGATDQTALGRRLRIATETPRYLEVARHESECSQFLLALINAMSSEVRSAARAEAQKLAYRSSLHRLRYGMYDQSFGLVSRVKTYLRILFSGGYFPDLSKTRLGPKAGLKDLLWGVAGGRRLVS